jgi:transcriptional regulator with GAF, ATPase, and Fis domain
MANGWEYADYGDVPVVNGESPRGAQNLSGNVDNRNDGKGLICFSEDVMPQSYNDLLFCSTFLLVLLALLGFRKKLIKIDRESFGKILVGLAFLTGVSILQLLGNLQVLNGIPYLEGEINRKAVEAIGIVAGLILLLTGVGSLLPSLGRGRRIQKSLNKRYFCLKMIGQAINKGEDLDRNLEIAVTHLSSYMNIPKCAAFKYSAGRDMLVLSGGRGFDEGVPNELKRISLADSETKTVINRFRAFRPSEYGDAFLVGEQPDLVVPVGYRRRLYGSLFCWVGDSGLIDDDLIDFMSSLGEMLGRQTGIRVAEIRTDYYRNRESAYERVTELCHQSSSVGDIMTGLFRVMQELTKADFMSVAVLDNSGENMIRYTIGSGGRVLLEKGVSSSTKGSIIYRMFKEARPVLVPEVDSGSENSNEDGLFLSCGMHSRLACPVTVGKKVMAVITLGHAQPGHFSRFHLRSVNGLTDVLAGVIQRENLIRDLEIREDHMLRLQLMERELLSGVSIQGIFQDTCEMLTKRMKCTVARVSLIDQKGKNLVSQACRTVRDTGYDLKESDAIPLSLLPWHRMTLDASKLMLINQKDIESKMPAQEASSALLPEINSAMLVPIKLNDKVQGIISIGEARNWNRRSFGAGDLIFAKDVAAKCSVAIKLKKLKLDLERRQELVTTVSNDKSDGWAATRIRVNTPLSSIIGAVELLKRNAEADDFTAKYYDVILKSADRVKELMEEYPSTQKPAQEMEPERVLG